MKKLAQFFKILGDANRLTIIRTIGREAKSVSELIIATNLSQTLVSFHLRSLREAGIVTSRRDGPFIYYSLADQGFIDVLADIARVVGLDHELHGDNHEESDPGRTQVNRANTTLRNNKP